MVEESRRKKKHWQEEVELSWDMLTDEWSRGDEEDAIATVGRRVVVLGPLG